jgi:hypothetical protein
MISAMTVDVAPAQIQLTALPPPIIVLGSRSTATAIVGAMLGCNPGAFALPQVNLFVGGTLEEVVTAMADRDQSHVHGLLRALAYVYGSEQTIISVGMARRWIMRRLSWPTSQVFDELRRLVAPRRLIDKSATYSEGERSVERILKAAPDAYFVHVVEHPLTPGAVGGPTLRRARRQRGGGEIPQNQSQWLKAQRRIADVMKAVEPSRLAILRMESLLSEPHAEISDLCKRLDLPNDDSAVADMLHPENSPFASLGPVGANLGDDPAFLRDPTFPPKHIASRSFSAGARKEQPRMLPEVAAAAAKYGYD